MSGQSRASLYVLKPVWRSVKTSSGSPCSICLNNPGGHNKGFPSQDKEARLDCFIKAWGRASEVPGKGPRLCTHSAVNTGGDFEPLPPSPRSTPGCSWPTMATSPVRELLVTYLMPEKCYEEIFVNFHMHGEASLGDLGGKWVKCCGEVFPDVRGEGGCGRPPRSLIDPCFLVT